MEGLLVLVGNNSAGALGVLFLAVMTFALVRSELRALTGFYSLLGFLGGAAGTSLLGLIFPGNREAVGAAAFDIGLLVAMLVGVVHSRSTRR